MTSPLSNPTRTTAWQVGALCKAIADSLEGRFNPVTVVGEVVGFVRASSGHCYFSLKDATGQLRCAMFRRAASLVDFQPKDGSLVEVHARLGVYEARGELQLVVEHMSRAGQGSLFEQFLQIKAKLEREGLFDAARKRPVLPLPRAIGVVTSVGAAAWHDTMTSLRRRVAHLPVILSPASVQGAGAPAEIVAALEALYQQVALGMPIDVILLVRGGGAMEDLWAFNDEGVARAIVSSPVPVVSGVGHETDFTIADFVADLRAPTPTAAAELAATPTDALRALAGHTMRRIHQATVRALDGDAQRLDHLGVQIARPAAALSRHAMQLAQLQPRLSRARDHYLQAQRERLHRHAQALPKQLMAVWLQKKSAHQHATQRLHALDPRQVLRRGYAWLTQADGQAVTGIGQVLPGQALTATLKDGTVDVRVLQTRSQGPT